ncbi:MAG TPA: hypothetical protein VHR86_03625, partial [Armatimonadota bacterium]|nr:hypothetical protein [Armatimonadota bacterium]
GEMGAATAAAPAEPAPTPAPAPTGRVPLASILGKKELPEPETLTDEELREEVRRTLFTHNRSAEGIARLREAETEKE